MGKKQVIDYVMNSPANTNKAVLEGMLDGMGGADVPTPTVEDAGKVLRVNESGNYALTEAGGGASSVLIVKRVEDSSGGLITERTDKTWKEVHDALANGTLVLLQGYVDAEAASLELVYSAGKRPQTDGGVYFAEYSSGTMHTTTADPNEYMTFGL